MLLDGALATELTLFHVNPLHEGVIPVNMDTADLHGDVFFDLRSKTLPIECSSSSTFHGDDSTNEEVVDEDLVITKLAMTVKGDFGEYGRCNACNSSDIDPFSRLPCNGAQYLCTCGDYQHPHDCNAQKAVGAENITEAFGQFKTFICTWENWIKAPWVCWGWTVVNKTMAPGTNMWYSHTAAGWCDAPGADPDTCTWSAQVTKIVNKSCSDLIIYDQIEAFDAKNGANRFAKCPKTHPGLGRNISDPCWIYAFYATVLGPEALLPGGSVGGMPLELLDEAFSRPFNSVAEGGCPAIPPPNSTSLAGGAVQGGGVAGSGRGGQRGGRSRFSFGVPSSPVVQAAFRQAAEMARAAAQQTSKTS